MHEHNELVHMIKQRDRWYSVFEKTRIVEYNRSRLNYNSVTAIIANYEMVEYKVAGRGAARRDVGAYATALAGGDFGDFCLL